MADPRSPDWRDNGNVNPGSVPANKRPWQPGGDAEPTTPSSKRNVKRGAALLALVGILVGIGWVLIWLRTPKPACLIAIGTGYEHNLLLPHNVAGWNGLQRLFANEKITPVAPFFPWGQPAGMRKVAEPVELDKQTWKQMWKDLKVVANEEKTVAVFVSMHGLAEGDDVYLLPNVDALDGFNASRISFTDVLESLKSVREKNVVLFLDLGPLQSNWPTGTLDNDFVDGLFSKYKKEIEERGNLIVICSAGPRQRSWASDELQNSVFTHYVTEGLQGAALDGDKGVITAKKLFGYVADQVDKWAQTNRARSQKPIMLGSEAAAEKIDLVYITTPYTSDASATPESKFSAKDVEQEWQEWEGLKSVAPYVHSPHLWRHYQDSLVRYEQLQRCGATKKAEQLRDNLQRQRTAIKNAQALDAGNQCLGNSFPVHQIMGFPAVQKAGVIERLFDKLRKSKDDEEIKKLLDPFRKSTQEAEYLQVELGRLLLEKPGDLGENRQWLAQLETELGLALRPIEIQWLKMLKDVEPTVGPAALGLALDVRVLAEAAALNPHKGSGQSYSEVIHRWIKKDVDDADALRRQGEDLLFGTPTSHREPAMKMLKEAKSKYEAVRTQAKQWRSALAIRDEVLSDLPDLAHWLALAPAGGDTIEQTADLRKQIATLGEDLEKLVSALDPEKKGAVGPATALATKVAAAHEKMRGRYKENATNIPDVATQKNWHELDHALSIPYADAATRMRLLQKLQTVARDIRTGKGQVEVDEEAKIRVEREKKVLLASLVPFRAQIGEPNLDKANLRDFYMKLTEKIAEQGKARADKLPLLQEAAGLCSIVPAALVKDVPTDPFHPVERLRRARNHQLLLWQAERAWQDHWFDGETPYYHSIAKAYVDSAQKLMKDDPYSQDLVARGSEFEKQKLVIAKLAILGEKTKQAWTTEVNFTLPWRIANDGELPAGKPMVWLEIGDVKDAAPVVRKELSWPKDNDTAPFVSLHKSEVWKSDAVSRNQVAFHAVYRGQHLRSNMVLERPGIEVKVRHPAPPNVGALAVRMDSSFNYGAISIILDNSGSMRWVPNKDGVEPKEKERCRFEFALDAMKEVLNKIPDSTFLSVLRFTTDSKDERKTDVEYLRKTTAWYKAGTQFRDLSGELDNMNKNKDRYLNFASPIARAIARSKQDGFPEDYAGPRVILVLTDGSDSVDPKNVPEVLKNAGVDKSGIDVVVVCFIQPEAEEFQTAEKQFGGIRKFTPASQLAAVSEGEKLGAKLLEALNPGLQLFDKASGAEDPVIRPVGVDVPKWNPVAPKEYVGQISRSDSAAVEMLVHPGDNVFVIAKRANRKFILERGLLGEQAEAKQFLHVERDNWLVSLLSKKTYNNRLEAQFLFEQRRTEAKKIQQRYPGFVWLEPEAVGKKLEGVVTWETDWHVAAPAFRIEVPSWPMTEPVEERFAAWFWPDSRDDFLKQNFVKPIPLSIPATLDIEKSVLPCVESVDWDKVAKKLLVRVAYEPGKPAMVALKDASIRVSAEHHYYPQAGRVTAYFDGFTETPTKADLLLIDVGRFKQVKTTQSLVFTTQNHRPIEPTTHFLRPKHLLSGIP